MKKEPLVSVLLSIYKVEEYLAECLDSIINQSYKNLEIVCVDNGSPDRCGEILAEYAKKDKRIKVITLKENKMLCGGRNAGLDNASGDFICFVDPDDWIEENHIKAMVDTIMTKKDPDGNPYNLVVNTNAYNYLNANKQILFDYNRKKGNISLADYNKNVRVETDIPMWGRLYRKSFLDTHKDVRFLEGFNTDNIPFTLKLFAHMKNYFVISKDEFASSAYWRRMLKPEGAITSTVLFKNLEIPACLDNLYDYLKSHGFEKKIRIMFHLFWSICYPNHFDRPRYYEKFKALMCKMEDDIKSSDVYTQADINLCNLLVYTNGPFDCETKYFAPRPPKILTNKRSKLKIKIFNCIPLFSKKEILHKKSKYFIFGIPVWKTKIKGSVKLGYLFGFIPFVKYIMK